MRLRRPTTLVLTALLPASLALAACGSDSSDGVKGFDAVSISGAVGEAPQLDWKDTMTAEKAESKVVSKGDGDALKNGDLVRVEFTLADGWTHKVAYDSYDDTKLSTLVRIGTKKEPQSLTDLLAIGLDGQIKAGQTVGTRLAVAVGSDVAFGDYFGSQAATLLANLNIGNEDGMLYVADIVGLAGPEGAAQTAPAWAPKVVEKDGVPTGLDFKGVPAANGELRVAVLTKGTGPAIKDGQQALVNYLGQLAKGTKPFDESFSKSGFTATLGGKEATVVKGWSKALVGQTVGSRVILEIPPKLGYGDKAQGEDIPANSTLYFVIDILDVADPEPKPEPTDTASPSGTPSGSPSSTATPSGSASEGSSN